MRRALGLLALLAVMLAAAAHVVLRGSSGFASGSGAVVQAALTSIDYTSLVLGASAGMLSDDTRPGFPRAGLSDADGVCGACAWVWLRSP